MKPKHDNGNLDTRYTVALFWSSIDDLIYIM